MAYRRVKARDWDAWYDRVLAWIDKSNEDGCWHWRGPVSGSYGRTTTASPSGTYLAHRVVYELLVGGIESGHTLDHLCFNTLCVNPAHLQPKTQRENSQQSGKALRRVLKEMRERDLAEALIAGYDV
jgi:hypothetical protein